MAAVPSTATARSREKKAIRQFLTLACGPPSRYLVSLSLSLRECVCVSVSLAFSRPQAPQALTGGLFPGGGSRSSTYLMVRSTPASTKDGEGQGWGECGRGWRQQSTRARTWRGV